MDNKVKLATGAGLVALIGALGYGGYECAKNTPSSPSLDPSAVPLSQTPVSSGAMTTNAPAVPLNANQPVNVNQPVATGSTSYGAPLTNQLNGGVPLRARSGIYAPVPATLNQSTTTSSREYVNQPLASQTAVLGPTTTTTTTEKTAYVQPSTAAHRVYVYRRVRYEKPGNIHVVRAMKHTIGFTANLPGRLRF